MRTIEIDQQFHGYRRGHQLLSSSCRLDKADQEVLSYLSDLSGPLSPGQKFDPYLTGYALPSGNHYVLAKTWQDFEVERSGCVFTRSLIVPMAHWVELKSPWGLVCELGGGEKPTLSSQSFIYPDLVTPISPVHDRRLVQVVEQVLMKDNSPIACFGAFDAEIAALRLLQAGTEGLRKRMSFCTYSLAPRSIEGEAITLQFAPISAKGRFSQWSGKKIGPEEYLQSERHEPEFLELFEAVFESTTPDISAIDKSKLFFDGKASTEVPLRIVLLWNRLYRQSQDNPAAVLGLLDISGTLGDLASNAVKEIVPLASKWLKELSELSVDETRFQWLRSFLMKIRNSSASPWQDAHIDQALRAAIRADPQSAARLLKSNLDKRGWVYERLIGAIAEALSEVGADNLEEVLGENELQSAVFDLMIASERLSRAIASSNLLDDSALVQHFDDYAQNLSTVRKAQLCEALLSVLWKNEHVSLFDRVIGMLSSKDLKEFLLLPFRDNKVLSVDLSEAILSSVPRKKDLSMLQAALVKMRPSQAIVRFLATSIQREPSTIVALSNLEELEASRWLEIINTILNETPNLESLRGLNKKGQGAILSIADRLVKVDAEIAVALLSCLTIPSIDAAKIALRCAYELEANLAKEAVFHALRFAFQLDDPMAATVLRSVGPIDLSGSKAQCLEPVRSDYKPVLVVRNLEFLCLYLRDNQSPFPFNTKEIVQSVLELDFDTLPESAWPWFNVIFDTLKEQDRWEYENLSGALLGAAMKAQSADLSRLFEKTFPVVHEALRRDRREPSIFSLFYYSDWDKCKTARVELVRKFMAMPWPPESLLKIALDIHEVYSIFEIVQRESGGESYLKSLVKSVDNLPNDTRKRLEVFLNNSQY